MGDLVKNAKCNKLLRKAVQVGEIDLVELILTIAADQGIGTLYYISKCDCTISTKLVQFTCTIL